MNLEGSWSVYREDEIVGQCHFVSQGLYWRVTCQCVQDSKAVSRLVLLDKDTPTSLGILIPQGGMWTLERRLAKKHLSPSTEPRLFLLEASKEIAFPKKQPAQSEPEAPLQQEEALSPAPPPVVPQVSPADPTDSPTGDDTQPVQPDEAFPENEADAPSATPPDAPDPYTDAVLPEPVLEAPPATFGIESEDLVEIPDNPEPSPVSDSDNPTPQSLAYDPAIPLPFVEDWQALHAIPDGAGGFLLRKDPT